MLEAPKNLSRQGISIRTSQNSPGKRVVKVTNNIMRDFMIMYFVCQSGFQLSIETNSQFLWFCIISLSNWLKKLAPLTVPVKGIAALYARKARVLHAHYTQCPRSAQCSHLIITSRDALARSFPRFPSATYICFKF